MFNFKINTNTELLKIEFKKSNIFDFSFFFPNEENITRSLSSYLLAFFDYVNSKDNKQISKLQRKICA